GRSSASSCGTACISIRSGRARSSPPRARDELRARGPAAAALRPHRPERGRARRGARAPRRPAGLGLRRRERGPPRGRAARPPRRAMGELRLAPLPWPRMPYLLRYAQGHHFRRAADNVWVDVQWNVMEREWDADGRRVFDPDDLWRGAHGVALPAGGEILVPD